MTEFKCKDLKLNISESTWRVVLQTWDPTGALGSSSTGEWCFPLLQHLRLSLATCVPHGKVASFIRPSSASASCLWRSWIIQSSWKSFVCGKWGACLVWWGSMLRVIHHEEFLHIARLRLVMRSYPSPGWDGQIPWVSIFLLLSPNTMMEAPSRRKGWLRLAVLEGDWSPLWQGIMATVSAGMAAGTRSWGLLASNTSMKQRQPAVFWWHNSSSKAVPPTGDRVFKCLTLWETLLLQTPIALMES